MKHVMITLIGPVKFEKEMREEEKRLTVDGFNVLSLCVIGHDIVDASGHLQKMMDEMIREKIDLCDRVHVINKDGYIGEHTASEINYAREKGKMITYMEPLKEYKPDEAIKNSMIPFIKEWEPHWIATRLLDCYKCDYDRAISVAEYIVHDLLKNQIDAKARSYIDNQNPLIRVPFNEVMTDIKHYQAAKDALMLLHGMKATVGNS